MSRLTFVHAADLHLDSPFSGLHNVAPDEVAKIMYEATFLAYKNIIDLCIKEQVDALLVAGDIFDGADHSLRAQLKFVEGLGRLEKEGIRSFVCHGNHDPLDGWEAQLAFPAGCHRFGPEVEGIPMFEGEPDRAIVYGISYPRREVRENLVPKFGTAKRGPFNIGLLHANVDGNKEHGSYAPCTLNDLALTAISYWALGHVHTRQTLSAANPTVVYPGNPQGRQPNERGARGVYVVEVNDAGQVDLEFHAVDVVRWELLEVNISELETDQGLLDAIDRKVADCQGAADGRSAIFRLTLTGRGVLHNSLIRPQFVDDVLANINDTWASQYPFVWCERVEVETAYPFDREQRRKGADFVGDLLKLCDESRGNPALLSELSKALQELYSRGHASRYLRDCLPSDDEIRDLVAGAEEICLAELVDEDSL